MKNFVDVVGLQDLLSKHGISYDELNFEKFYDSLARDKKNPILLSEIESTIYTYFDKMVLPDVATLYD